MTEVREIMPGIQMIVCGGLGPQNNIYLLETGEGLLMVDTSWLRHVQTIVAGVEALGWRPDDVKTILLTHAHPDHYGGAAGLKQITGAVVAAHEADAPLIEGRRRMRRPPRPVLTRMIRTMEEAQGVKYPTDEALWWPPSVPVDRLLHNGDEIGGWRVIHSPGHSPGNISLYSPTQKVLIAGNWVAMPARPPRPRGPGARVTRALMAPFIRRFMNFEQARASARRLAALDFETLLLSHLDPARFPAIAEKLRAEFGPTGG